jgi:hypothetical protein
MKKLFYITICLVAVYVLPGCSKSFEDLNVNENKPTTVPPSLLLNGILNDMYEGPPATTRNTAVLSPEL